MNELRKNFKQLLKVKGLKKKNLSDKLKDMGLVVQPTTLTNFEDGSSDPKLSLIEKICIGLSVRPQDLFSTQGFDDHGRLIEGGDIVTAEDIEYAAENLSKFFIKDIKDKNKSFDNINFKDFAQSVAKVARARVQGGDFEADNEIIKCMSKLY